MFQSRSRPPHYACSSAHRVVRHIQNLDNWDVDVMLLVHVQCVLNAVAALTTLNLHSLRLMLFTSLLLEFLCVPTVHRQWLHMHFWLCFMVVVFQFIDVLDSLWPKWLFSDPHCFSCFDCSGYCSGLMLLWGVKEQFTTFTLDSCVIVPYETLPALIMLL